MKPFTDPYHDLPKQERHRTTIDISGRDKSAFMSFHNRKGTLQTTISILLKRTLDELNAAGLDTYDPDRYEHLIGGLRVILPTEPNKCPKTPTLDDGCRVASVARELTTASVVAANPPESPKGQRKTKKQSR